MKIDEWAKDKYVEVWDEKGVSSTFRTPTKIEINKAFKKWVKMSKLHKQNEKIRKELEKLENSCDHHLFMDESGYPYNLRSCAICGEVLGEI